MEQDQLPAAPSPSTPRCWLLVAVVPIPTPPDPGHCHLGGQKCPKQPCHHVPAPAARRCWAASPLPAADRVPGWLIFANCIFFFQMAMSFCLLPQQKEAPAHTRVLRGRPQALLWSGGEAFWGCSGFVGQGLAPWPGWMLLACPRRVPDLCLMVQRHPWGQRWGRWLGYVKLHLPGEPWSFFGGRD